MSGAFERTRGFGELFRNLAEDIAGLLRSEARLARMELGDVAADSARGIAFTALGGVLLLLGGLAFASGLVLLLGDQWLPEDRYWLAALVITLMTGGLAAWLARRGQSRLSPSQLAPDQTVATLKEDKEWLKQQLT